MPTETTVVAWPTTQQGPVAGEPVRLCGPSGVGFEKPEPARLQTLPFLSANWPVPVPVVGLRMKSNSVMTRSPSAGL